MRLLFALGISSCIFLSSCSDQQRSDDKNVSDSSLKAAQSLVSTEGQTSKPVSAWDALSRNHIRKLDTLIDKRYVSQNLTELRGLKYEIENTLGRSRAADARLYSK